MIKHLLTTAALCLGTLAMAQDAYPSKPITLIVPNPPGGFVDASARLLSEPLGRVANQSVVVDNRGGGSGNIAYQAVARAKPDGYTLLVSYSAYHVGNPALTPNLPWDPIKDFAPVALLTVATNVMAVHPSVPANNLKEFIAYVKQNPGKLNYASQGTGSLSHIGTEVFKQQTGTFMTHIPYRGSGPAVQDVLSGQVQVFITTPPSVMGHVQAGKLKAFAVTGDKRSPQMPQIPTTAEAGLPGFKLEAWVGLFAPAGTPPAVIAKLTADVKRALELPEVKTRADAAGIELRYQGPDALAQLVKSDLAYWSKTIKAAGIKAD
ncbi:tripartite tricarboxylate transporter substrate binding protein [Polaromonas sp. AER18D-145]|uniref:Bug family tripartite tricarboxylate transporter substrate binding protein n=1 Tax=Polaromonas sp. AER18D-145 TaxID=1977060 RepID=UPI000BBB985A